MRPPTIIYKLKNVHKVASAFFMIQTYENLKHYELIPYVNFMSDITGYKKINMDDIIIYEDTNFAYNCGMFYFYFHFNTNLEEGTDRITQLFSLFSLYKDDIIQCCVNPYFFKNLNISKYLLCRTDATIIFDIYNSDLDQGMKVMLTVASPDQFRDFEWVLYENELILDEFFQRYVKVESPKCNTQMVNTNIIEFINAWMQR